MAKYVSCQGRIFGSERNLSVIRCIPPVSLLANLVAVVHEQHAPTIKCCKLNIWLI